MDSSFPVGTYRHSKHWNSSAKTQEETPRVLHICARTTSNVALLASGVPQGRGG